MKTHAVAFLFALIFAAPLTPAQEPRPPIRDGSGELLQHPSIVKFDGQVFDVAHNGGVARVPWEQMPPAWRSGYTFDPDRAADTRRREVLDRLNLRTTKEVMSALEQFRGKQLSLRGTVDLSTYGFFDGYRDARGTHLCFEIRDAGGRAFAFMRKERAESLRQAILASGGKVSGTFLVGIETARMDQRMTTLQVELLNWTPVSIEERR